MIPGSANPLLLAGAAEAAAFQIDRSLRFNSADSAYLNRTPSSASNRKTWTWSAWVKRSALTASDYVHLFGYVASGATAYTNFIFKTGADRLQFWGNSGSVTLETSNLLRDPSAWYHLVLAVDTTQATAADRAKIYINGSEAAYAVDNRSSTLSQNADLNVNNTVVHEIGGNPNFSNTRYFNGYLAEIHFIDGQALAPTAFGEYDDNNLWQPKEYSGTYGPLVDTSQTWSNGMKTTIAATTTYSTTGRTTTFPSGLSALAPFNSNLTDFLYSQEGVAGTWWFLEFATALQNVTSISFSTEFSCPGGVIKLNGTDVTVDQSNLGGGFVEVNVTGTIPSSLTEIAVQGNGGSARLQYVKINGKFLIDSGVSLTDNSFKLDFSDNSSDAALGTDSSGNSNTWTVNNLTADAVTGMPVSAAWTGYAGPTWSSTDTWDSLSDATTNFGNNSGTKGYSSITETWLGTKTDWTGAFGASIRGGNGWALKFSSTITITVNPLATSSIIACASTSTAVSAGTSYTSFPATMTGQVFWFQCTGFPSVGLYGSVGDIPDPSGIDSLIDTPTNYEADSGNNGGNYCVLNPLDDRDGATYSDGNLQVDGAGGNAHYVGRATFGVSSGKWYWEATINSSINSTYYPSPGICSMDEQVPNQLGDGTGGHAYMANGQKYTNATLSSYGASFTQNDIIGFALDMDAGTLVAYKNGTSQGTMVTGLTGTWSPSWNHYQSTSLIYNFGQRPFAYTPPTGYAAGLCTTNLPDPTIADGSTAFDTSIWSGNSTQDRKISTAFSPDFVWVKRRNAAKNHILIDAIRGDDNYLHSNTTNANQVQANLLGLVSDGYELGAVESVNLTGNTYVGWSWDGGSSTVSNTDGSITSNVRANASAGFSIVSYTGNGTRGATVGHGLNAVPGFLIVKNRSTTVSSPAWGIKHSGLYFNSGYWMELETADAAVAESASAGALFNATNPGSSVFTLGDRNTTNTSGDNYIAYCWAPVEGYSSFGSYIGNGSADGPIVFTGFRVRWLLLKRTDGSGDWFVLDSERNLFNPTDSYLRPNLANSELDNTEFVDLLSNGFKIRATGNAYNGSGATVVYAAYAEHPFASNARAR